MKFKKLTALAVTTAMSAGMLLAVPASAEEDVRELTYGVDYTCAAYFNNAVLATGEDAAELTIGSTVFDRSNGGSGNDGYYVAYAVFDISDISITSVSVETDPADQYKLFYTTTNEDVATKAPKEVAEEGDEDFCGANYAYYNTFKSRYGLTAYTAESDLTSSNYLVIGFTNWKQTTFKSLTITGTSTVAEPEQGGLKVNSVYGLYKNKGITSDVYTASDAAALIDGNTSTGLTVNRNNSGNYVNYVVFENSTGENITFNRIEINGDKSVVFGTDNLDFFTTINASTEDNSYDTKAGKTHFTQAVANAGGSITELLNHSSGSETKDFDDAKTFKYVFVLLNNWEITTLNEITLSTVEAPSALLEKADFTADDGTGYTAEDGVLTDGTNSVYGYKATLTGNGTAYNTVKAYLKTTDGDEGESTFTDTTVSGAGSFEFYVVVNKALDTMVSKVYCE
ncbi:MAG: hypothetical protein ACI4DP_06965 [Candidatus Ornithomonoglobus sp.]